MPKVLGLSPGVRRGMKSLLMLGAAAVVGSTAYAHGAGVFASCALVFGLVAAVLLSSRKEQQRSPMPTIPSQEPGEGRTKCFHGVRVVELATVVAVPSLGRTMAEHGAEVIKIETPQGDMWRKFFLEYEDERGTDPGFSSGFESFNLSKYSVVLDLKKPEGVAELKRILRDADVLLTNVRPSGLRRLGLDYDSLRHEFPSLVMAQLTAWGMDGPGSALAGYDIGAFWTSTGMASLVHDEGASCGLTALPDALAGQSETTEVSHTIQTIPGVCPCD
eukprot:COSAG05_NODE_191_length_14617_cov_90.240736_16_plen_275_part_00